jgi:hypothetical protein
MADMEIMSPSDRLEGLSGLSRATDLREDDPGRNPVVAFGAKSQALEVIVAQRVAVPRDIEGLMKRLRQLALVAGPDYYYRLPVNKKLLDDNGKPVLGKNGKEQWIKDYIEGPTVDLANDLAREYGNCSVKSRVEDVGGSWVIYGQFIDYERGFTYERPFLQRKSQTSIGTKDKGRQEDNAFQIGVSKAMRNAVVKSLQTFANYMEQEARASVVDKIGKDLPRYLERVAARLAELKIDLKRAERVQGRAFKDWIVTDVAAIIAQIKAITEGMTTADEAFPPFETVDQDTGEVIDEKEPRRGEGEPSKSASQRSEGKSSGEPANEPSAKAAAGHVDASGTSRVSDDGKGGSDGNRGAAPVGDEVRRGDDPSAKHAGASEPAKGDAPQAISQGGDRVNPEDPPPLSDLCLSYVDQIEAVDDEGALDVIVAEAKDGRLSVDEVGVINTAAIKKRQRFATTKKGKR